MKLKKMMPYLYILLPLVLTALLVQTNQVKFGTSSSISVFRPTQTNVLHTTLFYGHSFMAGLETTTVNPANGQDPPADLNVTNAGCYFWKGGNNMATTNFLMTNMVPLTRNGFELVTAPMALGKRSTNHVMVIGSGFPGASTAQLVPGQANWNTMVSDVNLALQAANSIIVWEGAMIWTGENDWPNESSLSNKLHLITSGLTSSFGITNFSIGIVHTNSARYSATLRSQAGAFIATSPKFKTNDTGAFPLFVNDNIHHTWSGMRCAGTNAALAFGILP